MGMFVCCEEILKEKSFVFRQTSVLDFFQVTFHGFVHRHLYCWTLEIMIHTARLLF
jgi:hypothetical protein